MGIFRSGDALVPKCGSSFPTEEPMVAIFSVYKKNK